MPSADNDFAAFGKTSDITQSGRGGQKITADVTLNKTSRMFFSALGTSTMTLTMLDGTTLTAFPLPVGTISLQATAVSSVSIGSGDYVAAIW